MRLPKTTTKAELRDKVAEWRRLGQSIALVPTMGALHRGHLSLMGIAAENADRVIVSIFVNPRQFGAGEDFEHYPRKEQEDLARLAMSPVDLAYVPDMAEIYPAGFSTTIAVGAIGKTLCGASRPGHFDGMATIVAKLLAQSSADVAVFGEKDFQQLLIIKRLVKDLDMAVKIIGAPIEREEDGLALSSRNAYLSPQERRTAPMLHAELRQTARKLRNGEDMKQAAEPSRRRLQQAGFRLDYLRLCDARTLAGIDRLTARPARLMVAAFLGQTRLIDNMAVLR